MEKREQLGPCPGHSASFPQHNASWVEEQPISDSQWPIAVLFSITSHLRGPACKPVVVVNQLENCLPQLEDVRFTWHMETIKNPRQASRNRILKSARSAKGRVLLEALKKVTFGRWRVYVLQAKCMVGLKRHCNLRHFGALELWWHQWQKNSILPSSFFLFWHLALSQVRMSDRTKLSPAKVVTTPSQINCYKKLQFHFCKYQRFKLVKKTVLFCLKIVCRLQKSVADASVFGSIKAKTMLQVWFLPHMEDFLFKHTVHNLANWSAHWKDTFLDTQKITLKNWTEDTQCWHKSQGFAKLHVVTWIVLKVQQIR